jgi:hypothetical protein
MITAIRLGGFPLTTTQVLLQSFNNGSFPATIYSRSKKGGYQGNKMPTPSFASYQLVCNLTVIGLGFSDLVAQRAALFKILGLVHSIGAQTLEIDRSDGTTLQIDIKAIQVTGDYSTDDVTSSQIQVTLEAEYPFLRNAVPTSQDILIYNGGGMGVPMPVPMNMTVGHATIVPIVNDGNYEAYPIFTFVGPLTHPTLTNNTTGDTISLAYDLATSADSLIVDCYERTVVIEPSGNNGRQYISGKFWTIPIGPSSITLGSSNLSDAGKVVLQFADTYLGI